MKYILEKRPAALENPDSEIATTYSKCEAFWKNPSANPQIYVDAPID
jgi:hypothetical protein